MQARTKALAKGIMTYVPVARRLAVRKTGGTLSARYCYSVWLRHLVWAYRQGRTEIPGTVAELGPGDSLGAGLAALLSGSRKYFALDMKKHASSDRNVRILDELVELYRNRVPIPDAAEFPQQLPQLQSYEFPKYLLTDEHMARALRRDRIAAIRGDLARGDLGRGEESTIAYFAPWYEASVVRPESVDFVFSQAVMEHVVDLDHTYRALWRWLGPGGWASHVIDFRCHHTTRQWNGHWACSDLVWGLIRGKRVYLINREPHSTHIQLLREHHFEVVGDLRYEDRSGIKREQLAPSFRRLSDEDLVTCSAFIQAIKGTGNAAVSSFAPVQTLGEG